MLVLLLNVFPCFIYIFLSALKKVFAEDKDIQKLADDDFVILNLVVSNTLPFVNS